MRGRTRLGVMVVLVALLPLTAEAAQGRSEDTVMDRIGDWVATLGKPKTQAQFILRQRRAQRAKQRARARAPTMQAPDRPPQPGARYGIMGDEAVQIQGGAASGAHSAGERLRQNIRELDKR